jgi:phosphoribosylaminoimidazole-succinocarboxamide synthase
VTISRGDLEGLVGAPLAARLEEASRDLYGAAASLAEHRGIILADTKFEFGLVDGQLTLIDELLTPDSSRFWDAESYRPGREQPSFDKQFVRDWLERSGWDKQPPAPELSPEVVAGTVARYAEAYARLTGRPLLPGAS